MKLIKCKCCGSKIAKSANWCPKCGKVNIINNMMSLIFNSFIKLLIFILCIMFFFIMFNLYIKSYDDIYGNRSFIVGDTFENKRFKMLYVSSNTNYKNNNNYKDKKIIKLTFYIENINNKPYKISTANFNCYADDILQQKVKNEEYIHNLSTNKNVYLYVYCLVPTNSSHIGVNYKPSYSNSIYEFFVL